MDMLSIEHKVVDELRPTNPQDDTTNARNTSYVYRPSRELRISSIWLAIASTQTV